MRRLLIIALGLAFAATMGLPARAQRAGQPAAVLINGPAGTRVVTVPNTVSISTAADVSTLINGNFPVPGFGFDYTHFAAVNRGLATRAIIDPATQHQLALARDLRRDLAGAVPITTFPAIVNNNVNVITVVPPPPVVIIQQPSVIEVPVERDAPAARSVETTLPAPPQPVANLGELVFIRNDGSVVFAVGYSIVNDRIVYVTREGIRRSFPLKDLDAESTRLMNEERGTSLRLPA